MVTALTWSERDFVKETFRLAAVVTVAVIANMPRYVANSVGLGYRSRYELGGRHIERPENFRTKAHKAAFENVGDYVCNALTRDVMICYRDRDLSQESFLRPKNVPIEVWHQILECFANAGFIQKRWELRLPSFDGDRTLGEWSDQTPGWWADGSRIQTTSNVDGISTYDPSLLTDEQKAQLLGTRYALTYTDCLQYSWHGGDRDKPGEQRYVSLSEDHFKPIYVRERSMLSEKQIDEGVDRLTKALSA